MKMLTRLKLSRLPAYGEVTRLRNTRPDAILLDAGCCCESLHMIVSLPNVEATLFKLATI
jgi:hypothetical protein